jgi:hypothetical protein
MSEPWTIARAQTILGVAAYEIAEAAKLLAEIRAGLPLPADLIDRQEGRLPYDVATEVLGTIECVIADDLLPAIQALQRAAKVTDADLKRDFLERKRRRRLIAHNRRGGDETG